MGGIIWLGMASRLGEKTLNGLYNKEHENHFHGDMIYCALMNWLYLYKNVLLILPIE